MIALLTPLHFYKRGHVTASTMFSLERALILDRHHLTNIIHKRLIALHFNIGRKILSEYEMKIALERMAENNGFIVMILFK